MNDTFVLLPQASRPFFLFNYMEIGLLIGVLKARLRHAYMTRISVIA